MKNLYINYSLEKAVCIIILFLDFEMRGNKISLVKSRNQAFRLGTLAEQLDPTQEKASCHDSFIISEPGILAVKLSVDKILENIMILFHRYSNLQGKILSWKISKNENFY